MAPTVPTVPTVPTALATRPTVPAARPPVPRGAAALLAAVATLALAPAVAAADITESLTVGARVGGYGFRRAGAVDEHGHVAWDGCRMNGLGVFARRPVRRLFAEAGVDLYFAESFPMAPTPGEAPTDRVSGLLTAAIGADLVRTRRVTAYAQLGAGLEVTAVSMTMPDGFTARDRRVLPLGFLGVGGELRVGARTALGAGLRAHVMGQVDSYGHDHALHGPGYEATVPVTTGIAAQGLFHVSYQL